MAKGKRGLGRGLDALLGDARADYGMAQSDGAAAARSAEALPIEHLRPGTQQPRRNFDNAAMAELTASIAAKGVLQPILVRPRADVPDRFDIVAGERRWRAAQAAGLHRVPVVVRDLDDAEALQIGLIENLQRRDLSPLEEAEGYRRLMGEFSYSQSEVADTVGKSRSHIANSLRLLTLPDAVKDMIEDGRLSAGHARAVLTAEDPAVLAQEIAAKGLSVRQAEALAGRKKEAAPKPQTREKAVKDTDTLALEEDLSLRLGLKVTLSDKGGAGTLSLHYRNLDQLDGVIAKLTG